MGGKLTKCTKSLSGVEKGIDTTKTKGKKEVSDLEQTNAAEQSAESSAESEEFEKKTDTVNKLKAKATTGKNDLEKKRQTKQSKDIAAAKDDIAAKKVQLKQEKDLAMTYMGKIYDLAIAVNSKVQNMESDMDSAVKQLTSIVTEQASAPSKNEEQLNSM